jgi:hypothetical protein
VRRWLQARTPEQRGHLRPVDVAVEVTHQHGMRMVVQQLGDEGELRGARLRAQRKMRDRDGERGLVVAEARQQDPAAGDAAGQGVVDDLDRFQLAQQAIGA